MSKLVTIDFSTKKPQVSEKIPGVQFRDSDRRIVVIISFWKTIHDIDDFPYLFP
ncbi:hypothetical protein OAF45_00500 [Candidatus Latescibacteria bacterium]|nr:hypothetical protein [Candidatus Latescibacterota bacterium]